jgi:hypothetical protein
MRQPGLSAVHAQPFTLMYRQGHHRCRYTPDFLTVFLIVPRALARLGFDKWTVIEVKPADLLARDRDAIEARLEAVHLALGFAAICLTENDLITRRH